MLLLRPIMQTPPFDPALVRDARYRARLAALLSQLEQVRQHDTFLEYAAGEPLFAQFEALYAENLAAYRSQYEPHALRMPLAEAQLEAARPDLHPLRYRNLRRALERIRPLLDAEDYAVNAQAGPELDQIEAWTAQAAAERRGWLHALHQWRMRLKTHMTEVWSEDYAALKAEYVEAKSRVSGELLPQLPLAPDEGRLERAIARRREDQEALMRRLRRFPDLRAEAQAWHARFMSHAEFRQLQAGWLRRARRRLAIAAGGALAVLLLIGFGAALLPAALGRMREDRAWRTAASAPSVQAYQAYLAQYPEGRYRDSAQTALLALPYGVLESFAGPDSAVFRYEGRLTALVPNGSGQAWYPDSCTYSGGWRAGRRDSIGRYACPDGVWYEGRWLMDQREGQGRQRYANGDLYEGRWYRDQRHGPGRMVYADSSRYLGQWKADVQQGQGVWSRADGLTYAGAWEAGRRQGSGSLTWPDGARIEGIWRADTLDGPGTFTSRFRDSYSGTWQGSPERLTLLDGQGQIFKRGRIEDGIFKGEGE